jgi:hypothetical protein
MSDRGGTLDAVSGAHVHRHAAEAPRGFRDRIPEREECDRHRAAFRKGEELLRRNFWARGYAGSTVGFERKQVRQYVRISTLTTRRDGQRCPIPLVRSATC